MTERVLPARLQAELDRFPPSVIAQYLAHRLGADVGRRELMFTFKDGRYQSGGIGVPLGEWQTLAAPPDR